jgi:hypothetical protein
LSDNKRVGFAKMMHIGEAKLYWSDVKDCLEMKSKSLISDWTKMEKKTTV